MQYASPSVYTEQILGKPELWSPGTPCYDVMCYSPCCVSITLSLGVDVGNEEAYGLPYRKLGDLKQESCILSWLWRPED